MRRKGIPASPKLARTTKFQAENWYGYYAGYSHKFVSEVLQSLSPSKKSVVLDPWNGSGTTTTVAAKLGHKAYGFDLNPVMTLVAKSRLLSESTITSLKPLAHELIFRAHDNNFVHDVERDPVELWLTASTAKYLRFLEMSIQHALVDNCVVKYSDRKVSFGATSDVAAFYYVSLFRTARDLLKPFASKNPTWIKEAKSKIDLLSPSQSKIDELFLRHVDELSRLLYLSRMGKKAGKVSIDLANSEKLPLDDGAADIVVTSPPYCTRIDYAVATKPELAILGLGNETGFDSLRRQLIGTTTVPKQVPDIAREWGPSCADFLKRLEAHKSKASKSYYLKSHVDYFSRMFGSLGEISRVIKKNGNLVLVVQNSFYKELNNDVPKIISEMAKGLKLKKVHEVAYTADRDFGRVNTHSKGYNKNRIVQEKVLFFKKVA